MKWSCTAHSFFGSKLAGEELMRSSEKQRISSSRLKNSVLSSYDHPKSAR